MGVVTGIVGVIGIAAACYLVYVLLKGGDER